ncbi:MAG TPA: cupin domain-containing protein [Terracidiphilus sp.]|jgi:oxalate decarboxylase/phosphoglucose isomerase-like protein (cupin superfamily)
MTAIKSFLVLGDQVDMLVTHKMTGGSSATLLEFSPPGGGPPPHRHQNEDETFYVVEGDYEFLVMAIGSRLRPAIRLIAGAERFTAFETAAQRSAEY